MTEDEFLELVKSLQIKGYHYNKKYAGELAYLKETKLKDISINDLIFEKWCCGGIGGGSCWGQDEHYEIVGDEEPDFYDLDVILEAVCPDVSFLKYKLLCREVIKTDHYTNNDYYGNSSSYRIKTVVLKDLYEKLKQMKLIPQ